MLALLRRHQSLLVRRAADHRGLRCARPCAGPIDGTHRNAPVGSRAFLPSELPAVVDLFHDFASTKTGHLSFNGLGRLLGAIGEKPSKTTLEELFAMADTDLSGAIDLEEFLVASDKLLADHPARVILVVGGPGSGKGLLCSRLVEECGVAHVSCGDLLRSEVAAGTPLGKEVGELIARGELVSSELITTLLRRRMRAFPSSRLLLDGFPRSRQNAIDFAERCGKPELALHLTCPEEVMLQRILKRAADEGRADDTPEAAANRIEIFNEQGAPTMAWLRESKVPIVEVDAQGTPEEVWGQLVAVGRLMRGAVQLDSGSTHTSNGNGNGAYRRLNRMRSL